MPNSIAYKIAYILLAGVPALLLSCKSNETKLLEENSTKGRFYLQAYNGSALTMLVSRDADTADLMLCKINATGDGCLANSETPFQSPRKLKNGVMTYKQVFNISHAAAGDFIFGQKKSDGVNIIRKFTLAPREGGPTSELSGEYKGGGQLGDRAQIRYTSPAGTESRYFVYAPSNNGAGNAHPLLIYLHGDYANEYSSLIPTYEDIAKKHNMVVIAVYSPSYIGGMTAWYGDANKSTEYLHNLIQKEIYVKYNIEKEKVYFAGASGGSQFITGMFMPKVGENYRGGGAVLLCGGGGPVGYDAYMRSYNPSAELAAKFKIFYYTGTADFMYVEGQVQASEQFFRSKGFKTKSVYPPGIDHCAFSEGLGGALEGSFAQLLAL